MLPSILLYCLWYIHPIQNPKSRSLNTAGAIRDQTQIPTQSQDVTIFTQTAALLAFMVCKSESGLSKRGEHNLELRNNLHLNKLRYIFKFAGPCGLSGTSRNPKVCCCFLIWVLLVLFVSFSVTNFCYRVFLSLLALAGEVELLGTQKCVVVL